jgi:BCD family chlorophyll transporter-like MFS transporter
MTGLGMHMTQTAGLALAADRATDETRPRVVALLYVMFLVGMGVSAVVIGWLLRQFTPLELIQVIQGCAVLTVVLNVTALWKQERVRPMTKAQREAPSPSFSDAWADYSNGGTAGRLLVVVFLGTMAFNMQDVLLEPYGGEILGLSVSATTLSDGDMGAGCAGRVSRLARAGWPRGSTPTGWAHVASLQGLPRFLR